MTENTGPYLAVSINLGVLFAGVLIIRALLLEVYVRVSAFFPYHGSDYSVGPLIELPQFGNRNLRKLPWVPFLLG